MYDSDGEWKGCTTKDILIAKQHLPSENLTFSQRQRPHGAVQIIPNCLDLSSTRNIAKEHDGDSDVVTRRATERWLRIHHCVEKVSPTPAESVPR